MARLIAALTVLLLVFGAVSATIIGFTATTLLSGGLASCNGTSVNTTLCSGGLASVAQVVRWLEGNYSVNALVIPYLDRETAFVQMHPLTWAVNVPVFEHLGLPVGAAPPSLFVQEIRAGWDLFFNSSLKILASNALVTATDPWVSAVTYYVVHERVAVLLLDPTLDTNVVNTFAAIESILSVIHLRGLADATVIMSGSVIMSSEEFYSKLLRRKPSIFLKQGSSGPPYYINDTLVIPTPVSTTAAHFINISVDKSSVPFAVNASLFSMSLSVPPYGGDERYYRDQLFLAKLADVAGANDPIVGTSLSPMPVHRNGTLRLCMGGACPAGRLYCEGIRHRFATDIAFAASGGFRGIGWASGPFKVSDLWSVYPFANQICRGIISGLTIWEMFNASLGLSTAPLRTLTASGDRLLQFAGMKVAYNPNLTGSRIIEIRILNAARNVYEPLERLRLYSYASESFTATLSAPFTDFLAARYDGEVRPKCIQEIIQIAVAGYMSNVTEFDPSIPSNLIDATDASSGYASAAQSLPMNLTQGLDTCVANTIWISSKGTCMPCPAGQQSPPGSLLCALVLGGTSTDENTRLYIGILVGVIAFLLLVFLGQKIYRSKRFRMLLHSGLPMLLFSAMILSGTMVLYCFSVYSVFSQGQDGVFVIVYASLTGLAGFITLMEITGIFRYFILQANSSEDLPDEVESEWRWYFAWLKLLSLGLKDVPQLALAFIAVTKNSYFVLIISLCIASIFFGTKIADVVEFAQKWVKVHVFDSTARKITSIRQLARFVLLTFRISRGKMHTIVPRLLPGSSQDEVNAYQHTMFELFPHRAREVKKAAKLVAEELESKAITEAEFVGLVYPILKSRFHMRSELNDREKNFTTEVSSGPQNPLFAMSVMSGGNPFAAPSAAEDYWPPS
jgi:hypothetical protein